MTSIQQQPHNGHHDDIDTASEFSEHSTATTTSQLPTKAGTKAALYTCLACHVAFHSADHQREHHRSDWHRYNMKRKVADLPPVTAEVFGQRIKAQQALNDAEAERLNLQLTCEPCGKTYSTENAFSNHLTSKKHKEIIDLLHNKDAHSISVIAPLSTSPPSADSKPSIPWRIQLAQAKDDEEFDRILQLKFAQSPKLCSTDCLFCPLRSSTLDENMSHMAVSHSFYIPDLEFLVDLEGLLGYLGEKVSVGNICLFCNGRGKAMHSIEAVRDHMIAKGHCKISYEDGDEDEIADFYDFGPSWEEGEEGVDVVDDEADDDAEWDDMDETEAYVASRTNGITLSEDSSRLTLSSGRTVISRTQNPHHAPRRQMGAIRPEPRAKASTAIVQLAGRYAALGAVPVHTRKAVMAIQRDQRRQTKEVERGQRDFAARLGVRNNNSAMRKHFKDPNGP
ncbi:hypothetical protein HDU67_006813 [Dinochytrium kinnereticum]|nr:hypothetical protein HDU67_006813 [Dinochytrium kinnereticum]